MAKSNTADLPGTDLLFGSHVQKTETKQVVDAPLENKALPRTPNKSEIKMAKIEETEPVKFTFYFDPQLLEDLEVAKFRLRMEKRLKISKSDIVNSALKFCLKDLTFLERLVKGDVD